MQMANVIRLEAFMDNHQTQGYLMKTITKLLVQLEVSLNYLTFRELGGFYLAEFALKRNSGKQKSTFQVTKLHHDFKYVNADVYKENLAKARGG